MTAYLIVNADDFGLTEGTNRAIAQAHTTGVVTSASLLANGESFDHAVELAKRMPSLGVGVHLTLNEGFPVDKALVKFCRGGELPLTPHPYVQLWATRRLPIQAIRAEFEAQVRKVIGAGIQPTHIDGHKYIHLLPGIIWAAVDVARAYDIPFVRVPIVRDPIPLRPRAFGLIILAAMAAWALPVIQRAGLSTADRYLGFVDTGHLTEPCVVEALARPQPGVTEMVCHPAEPSPHLDALLARGYRWIGDYEFAAETRAVASEEVRQQVLSAGWTLI